MFYKDVDIIMMFTVFSEEFIEQLVEQAEQLEEGQSSSGDEEAGGNKEEKEDGSDHNSSESNSQVGEPKKIVKKVGWFLLHDRESGCDSEGQCMLSES